MPLISIRGLTKYYRMGESIVHALDRVDLDIEKGEFVAITGASGSGKSTMMHLLGCLDRPTAGTYLLNGHNVGEMSDRELARIRNREIGFVFQTFNLINRTTALDNVGVPMFYARAANTRGPARRALERVGLTQRAAHTPSELSGGERQRVAIARAIVNDPLLLLADEPTGNLDTRTGEQIMEIFRTLNEQGVTIILVTHEQDVAIQTKRIVQMRDGKIILDKPTRELIREARDAAAITQHPDAPVQGPGADAAARSIADEDLIPAVKHKNQGLDLALIDAGQPVRATAPPRAARAATIPDAARDAPADSLSQSRELSEVQLPPRQASGAGAVLAFGIATPLLLLAGFALQAYLNVKYADYEYTPNKTPPTDLVVGGFIFLALLLVSVISGFISIFWGRAIRRKIREVPGRWIGGKRALAGLLCGGGTLSLLVVLIAVAVIRIMMKHKQP